MFDRYTSAGIKPSVVVTDDDSELCEMTAMFLDRLILKDQGYNIRTGANGHDLISLTHANELERGVTVSPHLLVLDNENDTLNGTKALAMLRQIGIRTPAIVMSGRIKEAQDEAKTYGLDQDQRITYLPKPFSPAQFKEAVLQAEKQWDYSPAECN